MERNYRMKILWSALLHRATIKNHRAKMFNKSFYPIVDKCLSSEDIVRQSCAMVPKWRFLRPVFPANRLQHISDLHSKFTLEMWANAQGDGRPAYYRWRPLFNAAVWLTPCSNAAKTRNPLKLAGVPQTRQRISAASTLKIAIL